MLHSLAGRWGAVALWTTVIFTFSSRSHLPQPFGGGPASYAAHAAEYAVLAFLFVRALEPGSEDPPFLMKAAPLAFLASSAIAAVDEFHQRWIPGRDPSLWDLAADIGGILLAILLLAGLRLWSRRTARA